MTWKSSDSVISIADTLQCRILDRSRPDLHINFHSRSSSPISDLSVNCAIFIWPRRFSRSVLLGGSWENADLHSLSGERSYLIRVVWKTMTYINADGSLVNSRSWFRLSIITDFFWGIVDVIGLFGSTLRYPTRPVPRLRQQRREGSSTGG